MAETTTNTPRFSKSEVDAFLHFAPYNYKHQRLGQAFCNHFKLYRSNASQELNRKLWNLDGQQARDLIQEHTDTDQ